MGWMEGTIRELSLALRSGRVRVRDLAKEIAFNRNALQANGFCNVFTEFHPQRLVKQAYRLDRFFRSSRRPSLDTFPELFGTPVSVKDLFDLRGWKTTAGSSFFSDERGEVIHDSRMAQVCRRSGVLFTGKTHLNEFAYGLTGENRWFGDSVQPHSPGLLTGGSSSGAAASVLGGLAMIGLGTDTGGSIRVPASLCGLVGFRLGRHLNLNRGMVPLAVDFDSCGWLQRHLSDVGLVYRDLFRKRINVRRFADRAPRFIFFEGEWLSGCEQEVMNRYALYRDQLARRGSRVTVVSGDLLLKAAPLFVPLQARQAAQFHRKWMRSHSKQYDPAILTRLQMGEGIGGEEYLRLQNLRGAFVRELLARFSGSDFLVAPASPFMKLKVGEDHSQRRGALLNLTTPFSLMNCPVLMVPDDDTGTDGNIGWQIVGRPGADRALAELAVWLSQSA